MLGDLDAASRRQQKQPPDRRLVPCADRVPPADVLPWGSRSDGVRRDGEPVAAVLVLDDALVRQLP